MSLLPDPQPGLAEQHLQREQEMRLLSEKQYYNLNPLLPMIDSMKDHPS